jgi:hypothetical protein
MFFKAPERRPLKRHPSFFVMALSIDYSLKALSKITLRSLERDQNAVYY